MSLLQQAREHSLATGHVGYISGLRESPCEEFGHDREAHGISVEAVATDPDNLPHGGALALVSFLGGGCGKVRGCCEGKQRKRLASVNFHFSPQPNS